MSEGQDTLSECTQNETEYETCTEYETENYDSDSSYHMSDDYCTEYENDSNYDEKQ